jgi:hypothetical protein
MLKKLLLLSVLPGVVLAADGQGVDALNGEVGLGLNNFENTLDTVISGRLNIPVVGYFGLSADMNYTDVSAKDDSYGDLSERRTGLTGFVRDSSIGKLSYNYTSVYWETEYDDHETYTETSLSAEGYLGAFTLAAAHNEVSDFGYFSDVDYYDVAASFYPVDNAKVTLGMMAEEYKLNDEDAQYLRFSFQPENMLQLSAGYTRYPAEKVMSFNASFFFDTKVSLIKRDRQYR